MIVANENGAKALVQLSHSRKDDMDETVHGFNWKLRVLICYVKDSIYCYNMKLYNLADHFQIF